MAQLCFLEDGLEEKEEEEKVREGRAGREPAKCLAKKKKSPAETEMQPMGLNTAGPWPVWKWTQGRKPWAGPFLKGPQIQVPCFFFAV
jgi:hypothetical protein